MNSPETERFLSSLKDFQRDTVDYAFGRMYEGETPSTRFLIADEVGLGKTKVAAGIVARATDLLRAHDPETPATRTDVSTTPLGGCFHRFGDNRQLRLPALTTIGFDCFRDV